MSLSKLKKLNKNFLLNFLRSHTRAKFEELRKYTRELEDKFHYDINNLKENLKTQTTDLSPQEINEIEMYYGDDLYEIEKIQINLYRNSTVISLHSLLESELNSICKHIYKKLNYPIEQSDLYGNGINRSKKYLQLIAGVKFENLNTEWSKISDLNKIRNCIVHCNGTVEISNDTKKQKSLEKIINCHPHLEFIHNSKIIISKEFIEQSITDIEKFLDNIYQQLIQEH